MLSMPSQCRRCHPCRQNAVKMPSMPSNAIKAIECRQSRQNAVNAIKCRHFDSTRQNLTGPVVGGGCLGSSGLRFGSLGVTWALQDTRFGSSGPTRVIQWCTLLHWDLDFTQQGSLGLKFGSLRLTGTQIWLIRAHWRSSGLRFGSSMLTGTQI